MDETRLPKHENSILMKFSVRHSEAAFLREGQRYKSSCKSANESATGVLCNRHEDASSSSNNVNAVPLMLGKLIETTVGHLVNRDEERRSHQNVEGSMRPPSGTQHRNVGRFSDKATCGSLSPYSRSPSRSRSRSRSKSGPQDRSHQRQPPRAPSQHGRSRAPWADVRGPTPAPESGGKGTSGMRQ